MSAIPTTPVSIPGLDRAGLLRAIEAMDACRRAIAAVDRLGLARARAAARAREGWQGPARHRFDLEVAALDRAAAALTEDLRRLLGRLAASAEEQAHLLAPS